MKAAEIEDRPGIWSVIDDDDHEYVVEAADAASAEAAAAALRDEIAAAGTAADLTVTAVAELAAALEKLPPDQPVTASDLLAILRPDTMTADAPAPTDLPAAGA